MLPEILNTRHVISAGALHDAIVEGEAVRSAFDERLRMINMQSFAMAFQSVAQQALQAEQEVAMRRRELTQRFAARSVRDRLRLLMVISSFPYPPMTGCYQRWWAMIRFLGQRHDLTLVTFCSSEQSRQRHELLRYCRSVYAAGYGGDKLPEEEGMPYLVRQRMRVTMRDALRAIPSDLYDAALIEQIVLAPFRVEINAPAILGEHNIESRLLTQAAQIDLRSPPPADFSNSQSESKLLRDYEDRVWPEFAVRTAVNPHERDEIQRRSKTGRTILVENGTNPDLWLSDVDRHRPHRLLRQPWILSEHRWCPTFLARYTGRISSPPAVARTRWWLAAPPRRSCVSLRSSPDLSWSKILLISGTLLFWPVSR